MQQMPFDENEYVACGWPWHGLLIRPPSAASYVVRMPDDKSVELAANNQVYSATHLFDMGLPDIDDATIEAAGGKWAGYAVLRSRQGTPMRVDAYQSISVYYGAALPPDMNGYQPTHQPLPGVPLWIEDGAGVKHRFFFRFHSHLNTLTVTLQNEAGVRTLTRTLSVDEVEQGAGQPECVCWNGTIWAMINDDNPALLSARIRDFRDNRALVVLYAFAQPSSIEGVMPPFTANATGHPSDWGWEFFPPLGLLEVSLTEYALDPEADLEDCFTITVLEDRATALGNPVYTETDVDLGGGNREYSASWEQEEALVNAFYNADGDLQTIRVNRTQSSSLHRRAVSAGRQQDTIANTTYELIDVDGTVVDTMTIESHMTELESAGTLRVVRRISATGETDDITDSGVVTGTASWADPVAVHPPGMHNYAVVLSHVYRINGVDIIDNQDLLSLYVLPASNRGACLALARDTYAALVGDPFVRRWGAVTCQDGATIPAKTSSGTLSAGGSFRRGLFNLGGTTSRNVSIHPKTSTTADGWGQTSYEIGWV